MKIVKLSKNSVLLREKLLDGKVVGRKLMKNCSYKPKAGFTYRWNEVKLAVV